MSRFQILAFGTVGLTIGLAWWSGILPQIYDAFVNDVLLLRTHTVYVDGVPKSQAKISRWRIKLPWGIARSSVGATIFNDFDKDSDGIGGGYSISIVSWLKDGKLVDNPIDNKKHDFSAEYFPISIDNVLLKYREHPELAKKDYCLTGDDSVRGGVPPCNEVFPNCPVYTNYHGWNASATVPRNTLYKTPQLVCNILRNNLDTWTISIDDLRQPQRGDSK